jgi:hypothetical protein
MMRPWPLRSAGVKRRAYRVDRASPLAMHPPHARMAHAFRRGSRPGTAARERPPRPGTGRMPVPPGAARRSAPRWCRSCRAADGSRPASRAGATFLQARRHTGPMGGTLAAPEPSSKASRAAAAAGVGRLPTGRPSSALRPGHHRRWRLGCRRPARGRTRRGRAANAPGPHAHRCVAGAFPMRPGSGCAEDMGCGRWRGCRMKARPGA